MPFACDFDECRYGLRTRSPGGVITNCQALQGYLKARCHHIEPHGNFKGTPLRTSEGYSKRLASAVFKGLSAPAVRGHSVLKGDSARSADDSSPSESICP